MLNIKFISIFAASGFIFSFLTGLFSKSKIYIILLKALIFGIIFGVIALLISYLYNKFLKDDSGSEFVSDSNGPSVQTPETKGQRVDFVVQDEDFAKSDSENHFVVGDNHQMLNNTDISPEKKAESPKESDKFVPLKDFESVTNFSSKEAVPSASVVSESQEQSAGFADFASQNNEVESDDKLDTLPDMNTFTFSDDSDKDSSEDEEIEDTGDTFGSSVSSGSSRKKDSPVQVQDASLMAKAISSILSDENS